MQFNAIQTRLPTASALMLGERSRVPEMFQKKSKDDLWKVALRDFQKLILCGTSVATAKEIIFSYLPIDHQSSEDLHEENIKILNPIFDKIAANTKAEAMGIVMDELVGMAIADPQSKWWIDGKTKLASVEMLKGIIDGEKSTGEKRGLILRLVDGQAKAEIVEDEGEDDRP